MAASVDDILSRNKGNPNRPAKPTFLPEPDRRQRKYTVISVDDHIVEPANMFDGRIPAAYADRAPKVVVENGGESEIWLYDGKRLENIGLNAVAGRPPSEFSAEPAKYADMRRGAWDIHARIEDMDLDGVYASLNFPSFLTGFGGARLQTVTKDLGLASVVVDAWNDWHIEDWAGAYPERIIPCQIPWLHDPVDGARRIRKNAERGFHAVSFPDWPDRLGFPSIHTDYWDPLMEACADTGTVVCLHTGSGGALPQVSEGAPLEVINALFGVYAIMPAVDWLFSMLTVRFPDLRICMSEGGIGWVATMRDRLEHIYRYHESYTGWRGTDLTPAEVFERNFWFCALDNPSSYVQIDRIGIDKILYEVDYPHADTLWPNTQAHLEAELAGVADDAVQRITWRNASELFQHPVPEAVQTNPDAF